MAGTRHCSAPTLRPRPPSGADGRAARKPAARGAGSCDDGRPRRPRAAARPRADRGQHLPRARSPESSQRVFGGQVAGQALVAAARTVAGRPPRPLAARLLPAPGRPACPSSTRSTASATAAASPPGAWSPSSTARPSSTCRPASTSPRRASTTSADADVPRPRRCPTSSSAWRRTRTPSATSAPAPPHRHPLRRGRSPGPPAHARHAAGLAAGRRRAPRRPACCTPASSPTRRT